MKIDIYTKTVLTIIAVSLCGLLVQNNISSADAVEEKCGNYESNPCYISIVGMKGMSVYLDSTEKGNGSIDTTGSIKFLR